MTQPRALFCGVYPRSLGPGTFENPFKSRHRQPHLCGHSWPTWAILGPEGAKPVVLRDQQRYVAKGGSLREDPDIRITPPLMGSYTQALELQVCEGRDRM